MPWLEIYFCLLSFSLVAMFAVATRSRLVLVLGTVWLAFTGTIAGIGLLNDFSAVPPRIFFLLIPTFVISVFLSFSRFGEKLTTLPWSFLIGFQAFRILVELMIHEAVVEGIAPPQMTWSSLNWDIVSGVTALLLFPFAKHLKSWQIMLWNGIALFLLLWVVSVAVLSFPSPFQQLKPDNIWVVEFPYVWLPSVMVASALIGHCVSFRKLHHEKSQGVQKAAGEIQE